MDLDVAPDESARPVRVGRRLDGEAVRSPGLAAVVDINGEGLAGRDGGPDDVGHTTESRVLASKCQRARFAGRGDGQSIDRLNLYPYVHPVVVVLQGSRRRAALHHEAEGGLTVGIGQTGNQSGQG